jgi:Rad3-related DNA helicase
MTDKVIKERMNLDQKWYGWLTALKMVQSIGRSVRSKTDWATPTSSTRASTVSSPGTAR